VENWEYASGYELMEGFTNNGDPTTFEQAQRDLAGMIAAHGNEHWVINPCVVKRSSRYPNWTPVVDHAAEVLAEVLEDLRFDFAAHGVGIMQGSDLAKVFRKRAQLTNPERHVEEYDS
jgi:hypothetical protein